MSLGRSLNVELFTSKGSDVIPDISIFHVPIEGSIREPTMADLKTHYPALQEDEEKLEIRGSHLPIAAERRYQDGPQVLLPCGGAETSQRHPGHHPCGSGIFGRLDGGYNANPVVTGSGSTWDDLLTTTVTFNGATAQVQLYCAVSFLIHEKAKCIIALAGVDNLWYWTRGSVPSYNWLSHESLITPEDVIKVSRTQAIPQAS